MFVTFDNIPHPRFFNSSKPRNKKLTSRNNSKSRKLTLHMIMNTGPVYTVIQKINDEGGMLKDMTVESSSTVESVESGDSGKTVVAMDT